MTLYVQTRTDICKASAIVSDVAHFSSSKLK